MEELELQAEVRGTGKGLAHLLRRGGLLPAVLYGHDTDNLALSIAARDVEHILASAAGKNALIRLRVKGDEGKAPRIVMLKDIQRHPVRRIPLHVDLFQVSLIEAIHARVPVQVVGADAVEKRGFLVQHLMHEVEVECLPTQIPDHVTVDVSALDPGDHITISDITPGEGVRLLAEPSEVVIAVAAPRAEEVPAAAPAAEGAEAAPAPAGEPGEESAGKGA